MNAQKIKIEATIQALDKAIFWEWFKNANMGISGTYVKSGKYQAEIFLFFTLFACFHTTSCVKYKVDKTTG